MKRWVLLIIAALLVAGGASVALAEVQGTHHDMRTYMGASAGNDSCYACHGFKQGPAQQDALLGNVGSQCYLRCHLAAGGVAGVLPVALSFPEIGVFSTTTNTMVLGTYTGVTADKYRLGHGMVKSTLAGLTEGVAGMNNQTARGWPYAAGATGSMECTTCHDVHSNTNAPFLRDPLSDNTTRANAFCHRCHTTGVDGNARWVDEYATAANGAHPSEVGFGMAVTTLFNGGAGRLGRTIQFKDPLPAAVNDNSVFRNFSHAGTALNSSANHYNPGGKLGNIGAGATTFGLSGNVGCYTCHATHIAGAGLGQLTVAANKAAGIRQQSDMCVGCHGGGSGTVSAGRNPGVTAFYHPVDRETAVVSFATPAAAVYTVTTGTFNIVVNMSQGNALGNVQDNGVGGLLSCMSCHGGNIGATQSRGVHEGAAGSSIISPAKPDCNSCHGNVTLQAGATPNSHHVYGGGTAQGTLYTGTYGYPAAVNYSTGMNADISNGLGCDDCHMGGNTTAHNWN